MQENNKFIIDFFEFSFLVETCIPPTSIARAMFWNNVIDRYYHQMSPKQRKDLLDWISKNPHFKLEKEECSWFYRRFDVDNQYKVKTLYNEKEETVECFLMNGKYHTAKNTYISPEYIVGIEKIEYLEIN